VSDDTLVWCVMLWILSSFISFYLCLWHRIVRSTLFEATTVVGTAPIYYAYNVLLCILQVLHLFWFFTIVRMAQCYIVNGKVDVCKHCLFFLKLWSSLLDVILKYICCVNGIYMFSTLLVEWWLYCSRWHWASLLNALVSLL